MEWFFDRLKAWVVRFWFLRGVALAFFVLQVFDGLAQLERYEILRGAHALIVGWNEAASGLGSLIGRIPFLPALDHYTVNALLFASIFGIPNAYFVVLERKEVVAFAGRLRHVPKPRSALGVIFIALALPEILLARMTDTKLGRWVLIGSLAAVSVFIPGFVYYVIASNQIVNEHYSDSITANLVAIFVLGNMIFTSLIYLSFALIRIKVLARGFVVGVTFILTFEVLYHLGGPELRDLINDFSRGVLDQ